MAIDGEPISAAVPPHLPLTLNTPQEPEKVLEIKRLIIP